MSRTTGLKNREIAEPGSTSASRPSKSISGRRSPSFGSGSAAADFCGFSSEKQKMPCTETVQGIAFSASLAEWEFVCVCDASAGTDDSDCDSVARHVAPYVALIAVDHDREPNFVVCRVEAVAVRVAGEHDIDAGLVEDRPGTDSGGGCCRATFRRRAEYGGRRRVPRRCGRFRRPPPAEPFALFAAIGVVVGKPPYSMSVSGLSSPQSSSKKQTDPTLQSW